MIKSRLIISSILLGLLIASIDLYFKTHISVYVINSGTVFGITVANWLLAILHVSVGVAGIGILLFRPQITYVRVIGLCVLSASLSNLVDRLRLGSVVDYIHFMGIWFNLADFVVTVGIISLVYIIIRKW